MLQKLRAFYNSLEIGWHLWWQFLIMVLLALGAAIAAFFLQPLPPPSPSLALAGFCGETYHPGETLHITTRSNVEGQAVVSWIDPWGGRETLFRQDLDAGEPDEKGWDVISPAGNWVLEAALEGTEVVTHCAFTVDTSIYVVYDFVEKADKAQWIVYTPQRGDLAWAGPADAPLGFAGWRRDAVLEDGSRVRRVLETQPPSVPDGEIWARYDLGGLILQPGDRFSARVGLLQGASRGEVTFKVHVESGDPGASPRLMATVSDGYLGDLPEFWLRDVQFALSHDLGRKFFYLEVDAGAGVLDDRAVWIQARIERPSPVGGE